MAKAGARTKAEGPRRLPRGRHALAPEEVAADQRRRLLEAVPPVVAAEGYEATSVADIVKAAAVSRTVFYANFGNKEECFAAAHEACHERLLAVLEERCERGMGSEERVETALGAALALLAAEPAVTRLLFVEAPGAGGDIALRYHEWLDRYATLLRSAIPRTAEGPGIAVEIDQVVIGGVAARIAREALRERTSQLRLQIPHLVAYVLAFYLPARESSAGGTKVSPRPERASGGRRRRAGG